MSTQILQVIGTAIKEGAPILISIANGYAKEKELVKAQEAQRLALADMRTTIIDQGYGRLQAASAASGRKRACPTCRISSVSKSLGRKMWSHMHSVPDTMPDDPTIEVKQRYARYIESMVTNMVCKDCSVHGLDYIKQNPVDASSPAALSLWVCTFHNATRSALHQPITHPCKA